MTQFQAKRIVKEYTHTVEAAPKKIFPLLCPVLEYDWIDGWACDLVYTESGVVENHCVFKTNMHGRGDSTWMVTNYEPENLVIGFAIFYENGFVEKLDIRLERKSENTTGVTWIRTYTGLTDEGNAFLTHFTEEAHTQMMDWVAESLQHYCATGEMLNK